MEELHQARVIRILVIVFILLENQPSLLILNGLMLHNYLCLKLLEDFLVGFNQVKNYLNPFQYHLFSELFLPLHINEKIYSKIF